MIAVVAVVLATVLTMVTLYFGTRSSGRGSGRRGGRSARPGSTRSPAGAMSMAGGPQTGFGGLPTSRHAGKAERRHAQLPPEALVTFAARSVRNELERARLRHAHRLAADRHRSWSRDDLMRIEAADILVDG
jgi:hypothetical protein